MNYQAKNAGEEEQRLPHGPGRRAPLSSGFQDADEPLRSLETFGDGEPEQRSAPLGFSLASVLRPLLASWPLLIVGLLLGPAIAAVIQSRAPATYVAEALVAPNRTITQVDFGAGIKTVDDSSSATATGTMTPERRQALVDLIRSSDVEDQVIKDLAGKVPDEALQHGLLIQHVSGDIRPRSEILSIRAVAMSPSDATLIANAWAQDYVDSVNQIYSGNSGDDSLVALRDQAQQQLSAAETALSGSMQKSSLEALDSQISAKQALLTQLQTPYQPQAASDSSSPSNSATPTPKGNQNAPTLSNDYRLAERRTLDDLAQTLRRIEVTRQSVQALLNQSQTSGGGQASDAAALAIIKTQLVSISDGLPSQLQIQLPSNTSQTSTSDLQTLAASLDQARDQVNNEFNARKAAYEQDVAQQIAQLESDLRDLRSQREAASAERNRLTQARDLAQETYTALAKKVEERRVADSAAGHEVELASQANFASPVPRQSLTVLAEAAVAGLLVACAIALFRWYVLGLSGEAETLWPSRALRSSSRAPSP